MDNNSTSNKPGNYINALPYLSILPLTEQCLDFHLMNKVETGLPDRVVEQLLLDASTVHIPISLQVQKSNPALSLLQAKALQKTFEDFQQQKGSLSLGYPIVLMDDAKLGRAVAAPLFLWKIELVEDEDDADQWVLHPLHQNKGHLNPILKNYLEARFELDWEKKIGLIDLVDKKVVLETCQKLADNFQLGFNPAPAIQACPLPDAIPQNIILQSVILGSFEPITAEAAKKLPKNLKAKERKEWKTKVAALTSNSAQDELIGTIFNGHNVVVEGVSGTGKTHIIASILPSLLADKGSALVVSPSSASFNDIQHHLEQMGIKNIGILNLQDEFLDKDRLISYLEQLPKRVRSTTTFDNDIYSKLLNKHLRLRQQLEKSYDALQGSSIYSWNWAELVGQCLFHHQKSDKQILGRYLDNKHFDFSAKEHYIIHRELGEHYVYYNKIDALKHTLNALHGRFFDENSNLDYTKEEAKTSINLYRYKTNSLYQSFLVFVGDYSAHLYFEYQDFVDNIEQQIDKIENDLHLYNELYGEAFDKQSSFQNAKLKLLSMFSKHHQDIKTAKEQLLEDFNNLKKYYENHAHFKADFPNIEASYKLADIEAELETFRKKMQDWAATIPNLVESKTAKLSDKSPFPKHFQEQYQDLEKWLAKLLQQINDAQILRKNFTVPKGTIAEKSDFLLTLLLQFQKLELDWRDMDDYYWWRKSWLSIDSKTQKVVQALVQAGTQDWVSGFQSWFFHQILKQQYSIHLPVGTNQETLPFEAYIQNLAEVQKHISKKADLLTKDRQNEQIKRLKREKDLTLTNASPIFKNKKLQDILQWLGLEHLGEFFPIVLASPTMAQQLLGLKVANFDVVIVDNAHDLPAKIGIDLLKLGNQGIVLGQPLEDENSESLLQWTLDQKGRRYQFLEQTHSKGVRDRNRTSKADISEPNTFILALGSYLKEYVAEERLQYNKSVEGILVDMVVTPLYAGQPPLAILCDGGMLNQGKFDFQLANDKAHILKQEGYAIQYAWSVLWWKNSHQALQPLLAFVIDWDRKFRL